MSKILFATLGSLGDVRPLLAIAVAAARQGHAIKFATSGSFRSLVERHGIDWAEFGSDAYFNYSRTRAQLVEPGTGFARFMALSNLREIEDMFERLEDLAQDVNGIVSTPLVMVAHLIAQKNRLPLVSCALSPAMLLANWGGATSDPYSNEWRRRLNQLRLSAGLPRRSFPQMERFSSELMLGMYPKCLSAAGDRFIRVPYELGYPFLDDSGVDSSVSDKLLDWLDEGPCALVSFGSYVDRQTVQMFDYAREACSHLGLRLLFVSKYRARELADYVNDTVWIEPFVSHFSVMRRCSVIVHHCGVGTLSAAAAAGRPMVAIPFGLDQVYNAELIGKRDLAEVLLAHAVSYDSFERSLQLALDRWPTRKILWQSWLEADKPSAAERAVKHVEAAFSSHLA